MILSKPFAIACSLLAALLKASAAEESITLSAGFMEATNFAERGEDGTTWSGFLFDLADVLVDKAAADGVTLEIAKQVVPRCWRRRQVRRARSHLLWRRWWNRRWR